MNDDLDIGYTLPHSAEAEQAVLGGLILKSKMFVDVSEIITNENFFFEKNKIIFSAMANLVEKGLDFEVVALMDELIRLDQLDIVGMEYISGVARTVPSVTNIKSYARTIKDLSKQRELYKSLIDAMSEVANCHTYEEASNTVSRVLEKTEPETSGYKEFNPLIKERIEELDRRSRSGIVIEGTTTGIASIDERFLGWRGGDLIILGGRPAMGKTALSLFIGFNVARTQGDVLMFSAEMQKEQLADRMISQASKVDGRTIRTAQLKDADWPKLVAGMQQLKDLPFHVIDTANIDVNHAINIARKFNRKKKLSLIIVDYLQLLRFGKLQGFDCVSEVSRSLKVMAKEMDCPVLALSQLSRDVDSRTDNRPKSSDLRSSGQIEQDADGIMFVYRDEVYHPGTLDVGITEVISTKLRNGTMGTDRLVSNLSTMSYSVCTKAAPLREAPKPYKKPSFE